MNIISRNSLRDNHKLMCTVVLVFILFLAFMFRMKIVNETNVDTPIRADARGYYLYSMNLKTFGVYSRQDFNGETPSPDAVCTPGYPLSIYPFVVFPPTVKMVWNIQRMQVLVGTLTVLFGFMLARVFLNDYLALLAAFLAAISPHLVVSSIYVLTEAVFTFLMVLALCCLSYSHKKKSLLLFLMSGITVGAAALTRPTLQYFIILLLPLVALYAPKGKRLLTAGVVLLGFVLIVSPWCLRNKKEFGKFTDSSLVVSTLGHGMYPDFMYDNKPESLGFPYRFDPNISEIYKTPKTVLTEIKRRFMDEPARHMAWYLIKKPITLVSWNILAGMGDVFIYPVTKSPYLERGGWVRSTHRFMKVLHPLVVAFAFIATVVVWYPSWPTGVHDRGWFIPRLLSLLMLYFIAVHVVGAPFPRYGVPLRPVMYLQALWCAGVAVKMFLQSRCNGIDASSDGSRA